MCGSRPGRRGDRRRRPLAPGDALDTLNLNKLWPTSRLAHNRDGTKDARQDYLSSQTSSMRQLLIMLLTIIVHPFTCRWQQYATRL